MKDLERHLPAPNVGANLDRWWAEGIVSDFEDRFFQRLLTDFTLIAGQELVDRAMARTFMREPFVADHPEDYPQTLVEAGEKRVPVVPQYLPWMPVYVELFWWKLIQDKQQEKKRKEGGHRYRSNVLFQTSS